jgi:hypothetical protein
VLYSRFCIHIQITFVIEHSLNRTLTLVYDLYNVVVWNISPLLPMLAVYAAHLLIIMEIKQMLLKMYQMFNI